MTQIKTSFSFRCPPWMMTMTTGHFITFILHWQKVIHSSKFDTD